MDTQTKQMQSIAVLQCVRSESASDAVPYTAAVAVAVVVAVARTRLSEPTLSEL